MATLDSIANIWKNLRELDLRTIREAAEQEIALAVVGAPGTGRHTLATQLRIDPAPSRTTSQTPILVSDLDSAGQASRADLVVLMLGSAGNDDGAERALVEKWTWSGKKVLVFYTEMDQPHSSLLPSARSWAPARVIYGSVNDRHFLEQVFASAIIDLLPDRRLALGRQFPLLRISIAQQLINETCISNATYALGTGLAEIVPVLDLPLNLADMIVLTKGQALLVYKLGLALGLPEDWQYYVTELGGVIGGGFLWRQAARSLIGLIPAWGIIPKLGIAYAGTYVVGHVVLQWYLTGRRISAKQMQGLYRQAFEQGKAVARNLMQKTPRSRLRLPKPRLLARRSSRPICESCGARNDPDARFCKQCGKPLAPAQTGTGDPNQQDT